MATLYYQVELWKKNTILAAYFQRYIYPYESVFMKIKWSARRHHPWSKNAWNELFPAINLQIPYPWNTFTRWVSINISEIIHTCDLIWIRWTAARPLSALHCRTSTLHRSKRSAPWKNEAQDFFPLAFFFFLFGEYQILNALIANLFEISIATLIQIKGYFA